MFCPGCGLPLDGSPTFCPGCGTPIGSPVTSPSFPAVAQNEASPAWEYATWSTRAGGYLIDSILVGVGIAIIYLIAGSVLTGMARLAGQNTASAACCMVILLFPLATLMVGIYNNIYLVSQRGYSIGQGVVHVKVVDANGRLLTQGTAFIRLLAKAAFGFVPFLPLLDLLWPLWDPYRQTLHDKAVGSYVIQNPAGM